MYHAWEKPDVINSKRINLIGSNLSLYKKAELRGWLSENGYTLQEIQDCTTFDEYLLMAQAGLNLYYEPLAQMAAEDLEKRLGTRSCYLTFSFRKEELLDDYKKLAEILQLPCPAFSEDIREMEAALEETRNLIGDTEIVLDYTFTFRILSFARFLLENGFRVTEVYADGFAADDKESFEFLKENYPELVIRPTNRPGMRFVHEEAKGKVLAVGQKAAYFRGTDYFVNVAESGGYFGFRGITEILRLMREAFLEKKDRKEVIQKKGFGCESCI